MAIHSTAYQTSVSTFGVLAASALSVLLALCAPVPGSAQETGGTTQASGETAAAGATDTRVWHHALSLVGKPRYGANFKHFDWVNPDAPRGGTVRLATSGSFDNVNPFTFKGEASGAALYTVDTLMATSLDEASTAYGLVAEAVSFPDDFSSATFRLRKEARFHDGKPVTAQDVIFSLEALKKAHPQWNAYYKNVVGAEANGPHEVTFRFDVKGNRELPHIMGELYILAKHYWTGTDADGKPRDVAATTLEAPLGSGPYRITNIKPGRSVTLTRDDNYWAKDLPVMRGQFNFDTIKIEYFRQDAVRFEAFKTGKADYHRENSSKAWANDYKFPAIKKGFVKREAIPIKRVAAMQAFVPNLRRKKFQDPRVRRALNLAFNYEWANDKLFSNLYKRVGSYFDNSELAARGLPKGQELAILEKRRDQVPPEVFTTPYSNPLNASPRDVRDNLKKASELLKAAGWTVRKETIDNPDCGFFCKLMTTVGLRSEASRRVLRNVQGEPFEMEIMLVSPTFERIVLPYVDNLKKLGIDAQAKVIESTNYVRRIQTFNYDMVVGGFAQSESPGNEQRNFFGSESADRDGSRNAAGIKNPAIDAIIDEIIFAKDRETLVAATRAMDRVLLWNHYVIPQWYNPDAWIAYWDKFGRPETLPRRSVGFAQIYWYDKAAAAKLAEARQ